MVRASRRGPGPRRPKTQKQLERDRGRGIPIGERERAEVDRVLLLKPDRLRGRTGRETRSSSGHGTGLGAGRRDSRIEMAKEASQAGFTTPTISPEAAAKN